MVAVHVCLIEIGDILKLTTLDWNEVQLTFDIGITHS